MKNFKPETPHAEIIDAFRDIELINSIPAIQFPESIKVKMIAPFGGVVARFIAVSAGDESKYVSVFLDASNALTASTHPVYEIYPDHYGDVSRFYLNETKEMIDAIKKSLGV